MIYPSCRYCMASLGSYDRMEDAQAAGQSHVDHSAGCRRARAKAFPKYVSPLEARVKDVLESHVDVEDLVDNQDVAEEE